jgi:hypothetical protein
MLPMLVDSAHGYPTGHGLYETQILLSFHVTIFSIALHPLQPAPMLPMLVDSAHGCPTGRAGTEAEVAASVAYLLSPGAAFITCVARLLIIAFKPLMLLRSMFVIVVFFFRSSDCC